MSTPADVGTPATAVLAGREQPREIILSNGAVALVDADDFERVSAFKWGQNPEGYAIRMGRNGCRIYMHRFIMGEPGGIIDHRNRKKLDNRKYNLRTASRSQNALNGGVYSNNTSGHRGVNFYSARDRWNARIKVASRQYNLGWFPDKIDAIRMRALAELRFRKEIHGLHEGVQ